MRLRGGRRAKKLFCDGYITKHFFIPMIKSTLHTILNFIAALLLSYLGVVLVTDLKFPATWSYGSWSAFSLAVLALNYFLTYCSACRALPGIWRQKKAKSC